MRAATAAVLVVLVLAESGDEDGPVDDGDPGLPRHKSVKATAMFVTIAYCVACGLLCVLVPILCHALCVRISDRRIDTHRTAPPPPVHSNEPFLEERPQKRKPFLDAPNPHAHVAQLAAVPEQYVCPISLEIMHDPVWCVDGHHVFERAHLTYHLEAVSFSCPVSRQRMTPDDIRPHPELKSEISAWVASQTLPCPTASSSGDPEQVGPLQLA
ncbi:U-box domain-containing protein 11 [Diplonema papillatum]|nr:U-box domain-containing protein 11 [Diplonema papillatum]KAJ9449894.1 U-box domain-containing protein 11 [Diplonema papillatum]